MNWRMCVLILALMTVLAGCTNEPAENKRLNTGDGNKKVIKLQDTEGYYKKSLEDELGGDFDTAKIWEVFKAFSKVEVGNDDREVVSGLLYECGFSDSTGFSLGKERFYVQFARQFSVYEANGEFSHMEQLISYFAFEPTDELNKLEHEAIWFFADEGGDIEDYFAEVENQESFKAALKYKPVKYEIYQTEVE